jgi:hypothetical protein
VNVLRPAIPASVLIVIGEGKPDLGPVAKAASAVPRGACVVFYGWRRTEDGVSVGAFWVGSRAVIRPLLLESLAQALGGQDLPLADLTSRLLQLLVQPEEAHNG